MDTISITRAILRRWWVVVPILLVTAGGAYAVGARIPPEYQFQGSFLLMEQVEPEVVQVSAEVVAELVQDSDIAVPLLTNQGGSALYQATADDGVITITATGDIPIVVVETVRSVLETLPLVLEARQNALEVPSELRGHIEILNRPFLPRQTSLDPPTYQAVGSARLVGGASDDGGERTLGGSTARGLLASQLERADAIEALGSGSIPAQYEVINGDNPVFTVDAVGNDPADVQSTVQTVLDSAPAVLDALQQNLGVDPLLEVRPYEAPRMVSVDETTSVRTVVALTGVGIAVAVLAAIAVDAAMAVAARKRGRREEEFDGLDDDFDGDRPRTEYDPLAAGPARRRDGEVQPGPMPEPEPAARR